MKATFETVATDALNLPVNDRAALAHALLHSLDQTPADDADEVQRAWEVEADRRVNEILACQVKGIPAEDVFAKLRTKYG